MKKKPGNPFINLGGEARFAEHLFGTAAHPKPIRTLKLQSCVGSIPQKDGGIVICARFNAKQAEHLKNFLKLGLYGLSLPEVVVRAVDRFILEETQEG